MDPGILQQRVAARMRRQELLQQDSPPNYRLLPDEATLHRSVGGPALMATQIAKLREPELAPVVFVEGLVGSQYYERPALVSATGTSFSVITVSIAILIYVRR